MPKRKTDAMQVPNYTHKYFSDHELGLTPDVSITMMALSTQPVIRVDFFRDEDAIQNE